MSIYLYRSALSTPIAVPTTPPRNRRGDIHSTLQITPTPGARRNPPAATNGTSVPGSEGNLFPLSSGVPTSSAGLQQQRQPMLSAPAPSSEPDEIRAIWGTNVNLAQTMKLFRDFLRGFKPKYRIVYDSTVNTSLGGTDHVSAFTTTSEIDAEEILYETYLRRMRQTGQTNLNVDMVNILAYPPSKKLHGQLIKYPQEVIPAMDQVLKDVMIELAEEDREAGMDGMRDDEGQEELADIMLKVYKVRPFDGKAGNMRELNPSGK